MRKWICLLAALALLLCLAACNGGKSNEGDGDLVQSPGSGDVTPGGQDTQTPVNQDDPNSQQTPDKQTPDNPDNQNPTQDPVDNPPVQDPNPGTQDPPAGSQENTPDPAAMKETAMGMLDRPVGELYDAIGQPLSANYAPSCLEVGGEDGELTYDGFTVYTVKSADGSERVYDVL